ncbi:MAG: DUF4271 domain-containing protein [Odoribacteraceae bacterium]|jgi:hypothetical protein|nr:DUF4271 domain-containing protein [Odoribacteraceae bacterium]
MNEWQEDTTACYAMDSVMGIEAVPSFSPLPVEAKEEYVEAIPLTREKLDLGFISSTLLCAVVYFVLLAMVQLRGRGILSALFVYFFQKKKSDQLLVKKILPNLVPLFYALCLSFTSLSLLIVYLVHEELVPVDALLYLGFFLAYHFVLLTVISLFGWLFNARECVREIAINVWVYNAVPGIALSPFVLSLFYVRPFMVDALLSLIVIFLVLYVLSRCAWWVKILFKHGVPIFYLILYLCALELLPLLVVYKVLAGSF